MTDHLGSVRDVAEYDAVTGITSIANHIVYDSFGNRISETNAAVDMLFSYTGREWDEDVDLQYNRARWYDPATGTWMSNDPIGFAAGDANLYRYIGNSPTTATDPSGLKQKNLPATSTVVDISTEIIEQLKDEKGSHGKPVKLDGLPDGYHPRGPCAEYAKDMSDALKEKDIDYTLHFYDVVDGSQFTYQFENGVEQTFTINADGHVRVEVEVISDGKEGSIFFDAGGGVNDGRALGNGNLGDWNSGVIPDKYLDPKKVLDTSGRPIMTEYKPPK